MIKQDCKKRPPRIRVWLFISLLLLFLALSGCGCLLPEMPCVPGVHQGSYKGFRK